ncbi:MAG: DUF541 domain-containing protein, partial [Hymenobacter sp.]
AQAPAAAPLRTVLVRGTAEQELDPEKLDLLLTYRFSDNVKDSERTQSQEEGLRHVVQKAGIAPDKLVLDDLAATGYGGLSKTTNASVALTKVYRLTLDQPQQLNTLVPQLVQTGADNLRVVNLRTSRLAATKIEVAAQAAADARQKATAVVKAAGGQLGGVVAVTELLPESDAQTQYRPAREKMQVEGYAAHQSRAREPLEIETPTLRKIKVVAAYDVVFEVKN